MGTSADSVNMLTSGELPQTIEHSLAVTRIGKFYKRLDVRVHLDSMRAVFVVSNNLTNPISVTQEVREYIEEAVKLYNET